MIKNDLKKELFNRWGDKDYPAEWDGNHFGGGKCSQRYWEYLWAIDKVNEVPTRCIDIGCGKDRFFPRILENVLKYNVFAVDPEVPSQKNYFQTDLSGLLRTEKDFVKQNFDYIFCISVLEHVRNRFEFCQMLDKIHGKIIMTFDLCWTTRNKYVNRKNMYDCLNMFKNHFVSLIETCPILADNSPGEWIPCGIVLEDKRFFL